MTGAESVVSDCPTKELRVRFWEEIDSLALAHADVREALSTRWLEAAQQEHASIASFAKFSLDLLAVGAPPRLLSKAHQAALDEVEHARICFALVSRLGGKSYGPGPLRLGAITPATSLNEVVCATIEEGCVLETLAAAEATHAAALATPGPIRTALQIISEDETRHGELAWEFVGWALAQADSAAWENAQVAFDAALIKARASLANTVQDERLELHGRLSPRSRADIRKRILEEDIIPTWKELSRAITKASLSHG